MNTINNKKYYSLKKALSIELKKVHKDIHTIQLLEKEIEKYKPLNNNVK